MPNKLLFVSILHFFVLNHARKYFFRGKPQTPKNQNPSPRGYRLMTYSPEAAEVIVPGNERTVNGVVVAVRDPHTAGIVLPTATGSTGADGFRTGPCRGIAIAVAGQYTIPMRTRESSTLRVSNRNRTLPHVATELHDAPVGRAIRKSAGKTHGTIIIPVFIDAEENEHEALESSRFKPIWDVVNALRSHDDHLAQELDQLRIALGQRNPIGGKSGELKKVVFDLPVMCEQSFVNGLRAVLVERTTSAWMFWFGVLQQYCEQNGDARPSKRFKFKDGLPLGAWVFRQRQNRVLLPQDRIVLLESLKGWSWDVLTDQWNEGYQALTVYVAQTGDARPPQRFKTKDGFPLGTWVSAKRQRRDSLSQEETALLESLKGWSWGSKRKQIPRDTPSS